MPDEAKHATKSVLGDYLSEFVYKYDFGDSWRHLIQVRCVSEPNTERFYRTENARRTALPVCRLKEFTNSRPSPTMTPPLPKIMPPAAADAS